MSAKQATEDRHDSDDRRGVPRRIMTAVVPGGLSDGAVDFAAQLAVACGAELELLHVLAVPTLLGMRLSGGELEVLNAERREQVAKELTSHFAPSGARMIGARSLVDCLRVLAGHPSKVVLEEARRTRADLIVLGSSGKRKELDFGGVARAVLSQAPCPVLLVPRAARRVRKLLVPVDLSPASLAALAVARDWAKLHGANLLAIHCFSIPELVAYGIPEAPLAPMDLAVDELRAAAKERFDREMSRFDWRNVPWDARLFDDAPEQTILEIQDDFDLIVMSTHGHTGLSAALLGSVAYNVMRRAHTPILACPARA